MSLNDSILAATGGPTVNDGLRAWFSVGVASPQNYALNDLERAWLKVQVPASQATTVNDLWVDYLNGIGGIAQGTLNDMQRQYWRDQLTPPIVGPNQHNLLVGNGGSAVGYLSGGYGDIDPKTVGAGTLSGVYVGSNDVTYIEFVGGIQLAGVLNIEVRTPNGRVVCAWVPATLNYRADPSIGLFDALSTEVDNTITISIVTL